MKLARLLLLLLLAAPVLAEPPDTANIAKALAKAAMNAGGLMPTGGIVLQLQNQGTALATRGGGLVILNCSTNMTCSFSGSTFTMTSAAGGGGAPGGSNTQIQYNNAAAFGGAANFTYTVGTGVVGLAQLANSNDTLYMNRFTDASPTGNFEHFQNAAKNADLWVLDVSGTVTVGIVPYARLASFPAACGANLFATQIAATPGCTQPSFANLSGTATSGQVPHALLSAFHTDTTAAAAVRGDGVFAIGAGPTWQRLAHSAATGGYFKWNGTDIIASTGAASGTGTPAACSNQVVTGFTLNADAAPTSTCTSLISAFLPAIQFDKTASGLANPTADSTFTQPSTSTAGWTLAGTAPASVSTTPGTAATTLLNVNGVAGGATSNATGTAGVGSSPTIAGGIGGAGTGTNAIGGAGGNVNLSPGNGGASAGTGINSNGGSVVVTPGTAGSGGSGTAGKAGVFQVAGANAGFIYLSQGSANTTANTNIPANSIIEEAPSAVTAYTINKPGVAPTNNNSAQLYSNASPAVGAWAKMPQTAITSGTAYTNATTTFSDVIGGSGQKLQFSVEASTNYQATCYILWQGSAATTGPKFQWTGPASPTAVAASLFTAVTASTFISASATAFSSSMADTGAITTATNFDAIVTLGLVNGANAGTVTLQAAANGVGTLTIQPGSFCTLQ